jgi:hypothetical protein
MFNTEVRSTQSLNMKCLCALRLLCVKKIKKSCKE